MTYLTMTETSALAAPPPPTARRSASFSASQAPRPSSLVLSADFACVSLLAAALAEHGPTTVVRLRDYLTYGKSDRRWPTARPGLGLRRETWVFPPGYGGRLAGLFRPWLRARIERAARQLSRGNAVGNGSFAPPLVVVPFPYLTPALRGLPADRLVYYNLDDYVLYPRGWSDAVADAEEELVRRSRLVACASRYQAERFRARFPEKEVIHLPLAVPTEFLNHDPQPPAGEATGVFDVGYVGTLNDRVNWRFCGEVAARCPDVRFTFVGPLHDANPRGGTRPDWQADRDRALAMPNVRYVPPVAHGEVVRFYQDFSASWIPYDVEHPFNVASCPTKIMDGLAAGRPVLSTDLPECRLYPEWITIVGNPEAAAGQVARLRASAREPAERLRAARQVAFAAAQTWEQHAERLLGLLDADAAEA